MKLYNCPDCTHTEDNCKNCSRYQMYHRTNLDECNLWWSYQNFDTLTFTDIPPACQKCPNHPSNGGNGNCNCMLSGCDFTYSVGRDSQCLK